MHAHYAACIKNNLPPLGSRVRVSITPCGFRSGRKRVRVGFSRGFSRLLLPQISFHHFFTLISFHPPQWWYVRHPCYSQIFKYRGFIPSHPLTRPCVGHELKTYYICIYTGCKKIRIQTLRVCRRDKLKPFCYVTNIWQVLRFIARGPLKVWRSMVLQKLLKMLGNYIIFIRDILPEMLENVPLQVRQRLWFQHDGAPAHFSLDVREYLNNVFPNPWSGRGGPVQWPPRSPDLTPMDFFIWGRWSVWCTRHR